MPRFKRICYNLYSMDMYYGLMQPRPEHRLQCFLITEHANTEDFINKQVLQLMTAGCDIFDIVGKERFLWKKTIETYDNKQLFGKERRLVHLEPHDTVESFAENLISFLKTYSFVPNDGYIIYDDVNIYNNVKDIINGFFPLHLSDI